MAEDDVWNIETCSVNLKVWLYFLNININIIIAMLLK